MNEKLSCNCRSMFGFVILCCLTAKVVSSSALWPSGEYGLPMPRSGCPDTNDFTWTSGYIFQDLEDGSSSKTIISPNSNLQANVSNDVLQYFCIKSNQTIVSDTNRKPWPAGNYCIYQKGKSCPSGMSSGSVLWDDENANGNNKNARNGSLPEGVFIEDTKIFFCCQSKGAVTTSIELPIDKPFYLIAYGRSCQQVLNTVNTMEHIIYDTEDDNNHDQATSPHPYGAGWVHPRIYYCYYQAVNITTPSITTAGSNDKRTTSLSSQTTKRSTLPWANTSSAPPTTRPPSTKDTNTYGTESTAASLKTSQRTSTAKPRSGTIVGDTESVLQTDKGSENSPGTVLYIIIGLLAALIVVGGVVAAVVFCHFRNRRKNDGNRKDQERLAVSFSKEENTATPDMKQKSDTNNKERYENVGNGKSGCDRAKNGDCPSSPNAYEEIKDKENPLYGHRDGYNTYDELKSSDNPLYR